ncbi:site-specific integrase [Lachnoclostridium phytofermentans]|uniref:site-specific integrase n=1 Tax=Lachnoclostridium phytofermentans TaxID=66219 RepID=UPI0004952FB5|nr:site-specific integrase [Lachnoclostridium phytofermentans]
MAKAKKLPSGQWRTLVYDYTDSAGKRHYESFTADTKKESEYMAAEFALNKKSRIKIDITFKEARDKYCESKNNILSPSTINGYKQMDTYFGCIDNIKLSKLTQEHIQLWANEFASTHAPKTVHNAHGYISAILKSYAPNIALNTSLPQKIKPVYYVPSDSDIRIIIDYLKENDIEMLKAVCLSAFGTLRRSEICGLDASDINGNTLYIHKALVKNADKQLKIKTTKTTSSSRYVEMPAFVIDLLPKQGAIVSLTPDAITRRFFRLLNKLNINQFRFHDLRHYSASIMHAIGIPDQYIMARGGWGSDKVLKAIYRGTIDDYQKRFTDLTNTHFDELCNTECNTKK